MKAKYIMQSPIYGFMVYGAYLEHIGRIPFWGWLINHIYLFILLLLMSKSAK